MDGEVGCIRFDKDEGDGSAMAEALPADMPARRGNRAGILGRHGFERDTFDEPRRSRCRPAMTTRAMSTTTIHEKRSTSDSGGDLANWRERAGGFDDTASRWIKHSPPVSAYVTIC